MKHTPTTLGAFRSADIATIPIASGVLTITSAMVIAQAQIGTADDIDTITPNIESINSTDRYFILIEADAGDTITLKHGTGNLSFVNGTDIVLASGERSLLFGSAALGFDDVALSAGAGGSMSSFTAAGDSGTPQTISDSNTLTIAGGDGIDTVAGAPDTVTVAVDSTVTRNSAAQTLANKILSQLHLLIGGFKAIFTHAFTADRTVTLPGDADVTLVGAATTQTLTNKTLTTPTIGDFSNAGHNHTNAAGGGQLTDAALSSAVSISKGGTGQTTQTTAMDALSPTTTKGDLLADNGTNVIRLPVGTNGQVLKANSGVSAGVEWADESSGATVVAANTIYKAGSNYTTSSTSFSDVDSTNVKVTATLVAGGKVDVSVDFVCQKNTGGSGYARITDGTNHSNEREITSAAADREVTLRWIFDSPGAGSTTYKLQFRSSDASVFTIFASLAINMNLLQIA